MPGRYLIVGAGPAGLAAFHALNNLGIETELVSSPEGRKDLEWLSSVNRTIRVNGKLGNAKIWGSCIHKIPFEKIDIEGLTREDYEHSVAQIQKLLNLGELNWTEENYSLYYHFKKNLLVNNDIEQILCAAVTASVEKISKLVTDEIFVEFTSGKKEIYDKVLLCVPQTNILPIMKFNDDNYFRAREHFLDISGKVEFKHKVSPQKFTYWGNNVNIRLHFDTQLTSTYLIPTLVNPFLRNQNSIVEIRRKFIQYFMERNIVQMTMIGLRYPLSILSLILWYFRKHPKTKYFDCMAMVDREIAVRRRSDYLEVKMLGPNKLSVSEREQIQDCIDAHDAKITFSNVEFFENCQHMGGYQMGELSIASDRRVNGWEVYALGMSLMDFHSVSNPTFTMMALSYYHTRKIFENVV